MVKRCYCYRYFDRAPVLCSHVCRDGSVQAGQTERGQGGGGVRSGVLLPEMETAVQAVGVCGLLLAGELFLQVQLGIV